MAVSCKKLFLILADRDISNTRLQKMAGYSANITTPLKSSAYVSFETAEKIFRVPDCKVDDIVEFMPEGRRTL